jgi:hypothetical protein
MHLRSTLQGLRAKDFFVGQKITEFGIGDGRNIRTLGSNAGVFGIDIEKWRVEVASINLAYDRIHDGFKLWSGDVLHYLQKLVRSGANLTGRVIMCLPQSTEGQNTSDRYEESLSLHHYKSQWGASGLALNAGVLDALKEIADGSLRALVCLSDRVPEETKQRLFSETGWVVEDIFKTPDPIQQDPDTGVFWVTKIDDGQRFFEKVANRFSPISASEAERRRLAFESSQPGAGLNVYHGLSIYQLRRK